MTTTCVSLIVFLLMILVKLHFFRMDVKLLTHCIPAKDLKVSFSASHDAVNESVLAENVTVYSSTESSSQASRKIFARDLTRYDWEQKYHTGNLVTSNSEYFAYALRGKIIDISCN